MALKPGDTIDRYTLVAPLGSGGQASVWRVKDPLNSERDFAAKLTPMALTSDASLERLRREARQLVRLAHPSLVKSHALFEDLQRDVLGLVMSFVDGEALDDALDRGALSSDHKWWLLRHLASALAYIHEEQLIHRDLKLQNVLLDRRFYANPAEPSHVKLVDFGIAAPVVNDRPITQVGHVVGTPPYLAPESIEPHHWHFPVGPAVDVFAFGVVVWRLFCGGHPTGLPPGSTLLDYARVYRQASEGGAWPPPTGKPGLDQLLAATLAVRADQRAPNGAALVSLLEHQILPPPIVGDTTIAEAPRFEHGTSVNTFVPPISSAGQYSGAPQTESYVGTPAPPGQHISRPEPPGPAPRSKGPLLFSGCLVALLVGGGALFVMVLWAGGFLSSPQAKGTVTATQTARAPVAPTSQPTGQRELRMPRNICPKATTLCDCCKSGSDCRGACGDDLTDEPVRLRYGGGGKTGANLPSLYPGSTVCIQVSGKPEERRCMSTAEGSSTIYLRTTGQEIRERGLDVEVRDAKGQLIAYQNGPTRDLQRGAFCIGFWFNSVTGDKRAQPVSFYVDPDSDVVPTRCK